MYKWENVNSCAITQFQQLLIFCPLVCCGFCLLTTSRQPQEKALFGELMLTFAAPFLWERVHSWRTEETAPFSVSNPESVHRKPGWQRTSVPSLTWQRVRLASCLSASQERCNSSWARWPWMWQWEPPALSCRWEPVASGQRLFRRLRSLGQSVLNKGEGFLGFSC